MGISSAALSNVHRGVWGLEITESGESILVGLTNTLATHRDFERALDVVLDQRGTSLADVGSSGRVRQFEAEQVLVGVGDPPTVQRMERGDTCVPVEAVTRDAVATLVEGMSD